MSKQSLGMKQQIHTPCISQVGSLTLTMGKDREAVADVPPANSFVRWFVWLDAVKPWAGSATA